MSLISLRVSFNELGNIERDGHGSGLKKFSQRIQHKIKGKIHYLIRCGSEIEEETRSWIASDR